MKKTDTFFLISNYNRDPSYLLDYCKDYLIYDRSEGDEIKFLLKGKNYIDTVNTGHNISDYFEFFVDRYDDLPEYIALLKGNIIDRHLSKEFFDRAYDNKYYTFLYDGRPIWDSMNKEVAFLSAENEFLEINNSWYVPYHPHKYSDNYNKLLKFVYKNPILPEYCLFSPGACYIISKHQVLKNSKEFYSNLNRIMTYTIEPKFPSEAHQVERMLHIIFTSNYEVNPHMNCTKKFNEKIKCLKEIEIPATVESNNTGIKTKMKSTIKSLMRKFNA